MLPTIKLADADRLQSLARRIRIVSDQTDGVLDSDDITLLRRIAETIEYLPAVIAGFVVVAFAAGMLVAAVLS